MNREAQDKLFIMFDPRIKFLMVILIGTCSFLAGTLYTLIGNILLLFVLLLLNKQYKVLVISAVIYGCVLVSDYLLAQIISPNSAITFLHMLIFMLERLIPLCIAMAWMITRLFLSDFVSAMQAMRFPNGFVITLTVIFRFFPTISYEFAKITSTMKMRGINPSLKNLVIRPLLTLEYAIVPLILRSMKIADDLTVAALTRGLTLLGTRTSYRKVCIRPVDIVGLLMLIVGLAASRMIGSL